MPKRHNLKQLEEFARDWGIYRWMNANNPDNEKPPVKKPYKAKPGAYKGKKPYNKRPK